MSDLCFSTNYSFILILACPLYRWDSLGFSITESSPLSDITQSRANPHFLRSSPKLPNQNLNPGASLVVQWLGVRLPMWGTRVRALVWEDPTCRGATRPVRHNYWACASGACAPQQERPWRWEARAPRWRVAPARRNWRKPSHRGEDTTQPKIN